MLLNINVKQQIPDLNSVSNFFERTLKESYTQLNSSHSKYKSNLKPTIKVILLYDEFSSTGIIEESVPEIFKEDTSCFVMIIRQLEILLYLHKNDPLKFDNLFDQIISATAPYSKPMTFDAIFDELSIYDNPHINDKLNHVNQIREHFSINFRE